MDLRSPRLRGAATGAILGGLIELGVEALGVTGVFKIVGVSFFLACIIAGAMLGATKVRPALWWLAGGIIAALAIVMYTPVAGWLIRPLVRADSLPGTRLDAIAVLSGGVTNDGRMGGRSVERLLSGILLARRGAASAMMISRESWFFNGEHLSDRGDQEEVLHVADPGVPVFFVDSVTSTRTEAVRMAALARGHGWKRVAVVTSPLHSRRACATFEAVGFEVTCAPSASRDISLRNLSTAADRLAAFGGWVYELAGTVKYRFAGWIR